LCNKWIGLDIGEVAILAQKAVPLVLTHEKENCLSNTSKEFIAQTACNHICRVHKIAFHSKLYEESCKHCIFWAEPSN
jgi:hypothetical protein